MHLPVLDAERVDPETQPAVRTLTTFQELRLALEETLVTVSGLAENDLDREDWARVHQAAQVAARSLQAAIAAVPGGPFDTEPAPRREISVGELRLDVPARQAFYADRPIPLARMEFALLVALARDPTRVYTKAELLRAVWGYRSDVHTRTVDCHASRLRRKICAAGAWPGDHVICLWGVGYSLIRP